MAKQFRSTTSSQLGGQWLMLGTAEKLCTLASSTSTTSSSCKYVLVVRSGRMQTSIIR